MLFPTILRALTTDGWLLFVTRFTRLFAYGSLSVILVFYLVGLGLSESQTGLVLTLTLAGDLTVSLYLTTRADRIGRRRMLVAGAALMALAGLVFAFTSNLIYLIIAGTIGVISPSCHEVGPFLSIEQASLSHLIPAQLRTEVFAWYTLTGSIATAIGALFGGVATQALRQHSMSLIASYRSNRPLICVSRNRPGLLVHETLLACRGGRPVGRCANWKIHGVGEVSECRVEAFGTIRA